MTTFTDMNSILREIATVASMGAAYEAWDDAFARKEVKNAWSNASDIMRRKRFISFGPSDIKGLSSDELDTLGFGRWDRESGLRLIPLWLVSYISDDTELTCLDGSKALKKDCDLDVRFGCIAYGIVIK